MKVAFFTGAGISANAGIPIYRAAGSSWDDEDLEKKSHATRYGMHLDELWNKHWGPLSLNMKAAEPTHTHKAIAEFGNRDDVEIKIITQNIDDLHERAGTEPIHLHGRINGWCMKCKKSEVARFQTLMGAPVCMNCGSNKTRPEVVLFGEMLNQKMFDSANYWVQNEADAVVVIGSSLNVHPAASMVMDVLGKKKTVIINKTKAQFWNWFSEKHMTDADLIIDEVLENL